MQNIMDPAILFFLLGIVAGLFKSNLEIPPQVGRFLSLYLLMALGLKGGFALAESGFGMEVGKSLLCGVLLAFLIPSISFPLLRLRLPAFDAAAIAATYGSVSAVTFITAIQYLERSGIQYGGHMAAVMAIMESPAIMVAIVLANRERRRAANANTAKITPWSSVLHDSFTEGAQVLLIGAMLIGLLSGAEGKVAMQPFTGDLFKGMLAFFLLDMGLMTAKNLPGLKGLSKWTLAYGVFAPLIHASIALGLGKLIGLGTGNTALLMVLAASASYIAVPAVLREAMPEARPGVYFGLSLGITFPLNILVGIPLYVSLAG